MRRLPAITASAVMATLVLAGCGGGSSGGTATDKPAANATAPADPAGATTAIEALYAKFFSSPIPVAKTLLEDGPELGKAFQVANKLKGKAKESAKVKSVTFTGATTANVKYDLSTNGSVVLPNADGQAVFVDNQWKVAKATFCGLVGLTYNKPLPNCGS